MGCLSIWPVRTAGALSFLLVSCASSDAPDEDLLDDWIARTKVIAAEYKEYGRVDDLARWAPELCRMPPPPLARMSEAESDTPHARKLYSVLAKNHVSYPDGPHLQQVVVKEAWKPELVKDATFKYDPDAVTRGAVSTEGKEFYPFAVDAEGRVYRATKPAGLFIMFSVRKDTKGAADGWVYATVEPGGNVTEVGAIDSCIECHRKAPHDGLFGLPQAGAWLHR